MSRPVNREFAKISPIARGILEEVGAYVRPSSDYPSITLVDFPEGTKATNPYSTGSYPGVEQVTYTQYRLPNGTLLGYEARGTLVLES